MEVVLVWWAGLEVVLVWWAGLEVVRVGWAGLEVVLVWWGWVGRARGGASLVGLGGQGWTWC